MNKISIVVFIILILLVIFGKLLPVFRDERQTLLNYGIPLAIVSLVASSMVRPSSGTKDKMTGLFSSFFDFCIFYFVSWVFKWFISELPVAVTLGYLRSFLAGPIIGVALVFVLVRTGENNCTIWIAKKLLTIASAIFVVQVGISIVESIRGESFIDYGSKGMGDLESRDVLEMSGFGLVNSLGLKLPFYGMLGQHNHFGSMLVGYNALWIAGYLVTRQSWFVVLLGLTVFAALGNTTRVSIIAVMIMNSLLYVNMIGGGSYARRYVKSFTLVVAVAIVFASVSRRSTINRGGFSTVESRIDLWTTVGAELSAGLLSPIEWVFGASMDNVRLLGASYRGVEIGSLENQYLFMFCYSGVVGLVLFIRAIVSPLIQLHGRLVGGTRPVVIGILVSWLLTFATLDEQLQFGSLVTFIAAVYVLGVAAESLNGMPRG